MCLSPEKPAILLETKFESRRIQDVVGNSPNNDEESKEPAADDGKDSGKATGDGELAQAIISCRGQCEGWLYKTSQKLGFFQADLFHKRYYRLNLMTEELKIFDKPDGSLKQSLVLSQCITKIDM